MIRQGIQCIVLTLLAVVGLEAAAQTNLVSNADFSAGDSNWDHLATGAVETNPETAYGGSDATNTVTEIDFNSTPSQQITGFEIGKRYRLAFKATRRTNNILTPPIVSVRVTVDLDGVGTSAVLDQTFNKSNIAFNYEIFVYDFVAAATTYVLKFDAQIVTTAGLIVDDVVVTADAPGGLLDGLNLWLKADAGVTVAGSAVSAWQDSSQTGNNAGQGTTGNQPQRVNNGLNFNPVLDFDGSDDYLAGAAGFYSNDYFLVLMPDNPVSNTSVAQYPFTGYNSQPDDITGIGLGSHTGRFTDEVIASNVGNSGIYGVAQTSGSVSYSGPLLINSKHNSGGTAYELFVNGTQVNNTSVGAYTAFTNINYKVGAVDVNGDDVIAADDVFAGHIAEVIVYDARNDLTGRRKIQSYLALKYGITLDQSSAQDYLAADGAVVYPSASSHDSYDSNIAGIGRDDHSQLDQPKSTSVNTDSLVTLALGNDFDNPGSFAADNTFLVWGHDGGNATSVTTSAVSGTNYERLTRVWRVFATNSPGDVSIEFDINGFEYNSVQLFLLLDDDGDFSDATLHSTGRSINGNAVRFTNVDFNNSTAQYFSLALQRNPLVNLSASAGSIAENGGSTNVTASLVDPADGVTAQTSNLNVTVQLDYSNSTATGPGGSDDFNAAGSILITAGVASNSTTVTAINDADVEIGEAVVIDIDSVTNASENGSQQVSITINDDDDLVMPDINSIVRQNPVAALTNASSVTFRVTFSETVVNVNISDFTLTTGGTVSASVNSVTPVSGSIYDVLVHSISGDGGLDLDIAGGHDITDPSGNAFSGMISSEQTYSIDNSAPSAPVVDSPSNGALLNDNTPTISGSSAVTGDTINVDGPGGSDCSAVVDGSGNWNCTLASALADGGPYGLTVTATDPAGNTSGNTVISISVDTVAPNAPGVGSPSNGALLNDNTPTISGAGAVTGDTINVDGPGGSDCSAVVDGSGNWNCTLASALADGGPYGLTVTATDPAGNTSGNTVISISVDTVAPDAPGVDSPTDGATLNDTTPPFSGSGADSGDTIQVSGAGSSCNTTVDGSGNWSCSLSPALADGGSYMINVTATDAAGNTSVPTAVSLSIDTSAPPSPSVDAPVNGALLNDNTPTISGSGATTGNTINVDGPGGSDCSVVVNGSGNWSCTLSVALSEGGPQVLSITAFDGVNTSSATNLSIVIDTVAPSAPSVDSPSNGALLNDNTPTISGSGADSGDTINVDGAGASDCSAVVDGSGNWNCTLASTLADGGPYGLTVTATDPAGNTSGNTVISISVDTVAPDAPGVDSPTDGATLNDTTPPFSGSGADSGDTIQVSGAGSSCNTTVDGSGNWSCALSPTLTEGGPYTINVTATDAAGNTSIATSVTIAIDSSAPVPGGGLAATAQGSYSIVLNWNAASDGLTLANLLQYQVFYSTSPNLTTLVDVLAAISAGSPTAALTSLTVNTLSSDTTYYFNVLVTDQAGNQAIYTMTNATTPVYSSQDSDGDGVPDDIEIQNGGNPNDPDDIVVGGNNDTDDDGIPDGLEAFLSGGNTTSIDLTTDSDSDGIPDVLELSYGQLSDVFGSDAAANNAPMVTAQGTLASDATDWFTFFADYQSPLATDAEDGSLVVTGRLHASQGRFLSVNPTDIGGGYHYESGSHILLWSARDSSGQVGVALQTLNITPQVNFLVDQFVSTGDSFVLTAEIMGHALTGQTVQVPFTVDLSSSSGNYSPMPTDGTLVIPFGNTRVSSAGFTVNTVAQEGEFIVFTMGTPTNAIAGVQTEHRVISRLNPIQPALRMAPVQGTATVRSVADNAGILQVTASSTHAGTAYNWNNSDNALLAAVSGSTTAATLDIDPSVLTPGLYTLTLQAQRSGAAVSIVHRTLEIRAGNTLDLDTDNDSIGDSNDVVAGQFGGGSFLQTVFHPNLYLMKTLPGLVLQLGATANAANKPSSEVVAADILQYGDGRGGPVASIDDANGVNIGGIFDFAIVNLPQAGASVPVVLAQRNPVPANPAWRKFIPTTGWQDFVEDANNRLRSAPGSAGECPDPGDNAYTDGLTLGHFCIELTLEDGGPNDADGAQNGMIQDPGGVIQQAAQAPAVSSSGATATTTNTAPIKTGGGSLSLLLFGLLGLRIVRRWNVCGPYLRSYY